jgi:hypothetical protein
MRGNPALPGGSSTSKPAWSSTSEVFHHAGFLFALATDDHDDRDDAMDESNLTMAQQIAEAASTFDQP